LIAVVLLLVCDVGHYAIERGFTECQDAVFRLPSGPTIDFGPISFAELIAARALDLLYDGCDR